MVATLMIWSHWLGKAFLRLHDNLRSEHPTSPASLRREPRVPVPKRDSCPERESQ